MSPLWTAAEIADVSTGGAVHGDFDGDRARPSIPARSGRATCSSR